jgi:hypothetical protein
MPQEAVDLCWLGVRLEPIKETNLSNQNYIPKLERSCMKEATLTKQNVICTSETKGMDSTYFCMN